METAETADKEHQSEILIVQALSKASIDQLLTELYGRMGDYNTCIIGEEYKNATGKNFSDVESYSDPLNQRLEESDNYNKYNFSSRAFTAIHSLRKIQREVREIINIP